MIIESLSRGLRAVEILAEHQPIGVTELARRLGLPKSTTQRLLETLEAAGWARKTGEDMTRWRLTRIALGMRRFTSLERDLREAARPHLAELGRLTGETVHLLLREGSTCMVLIDRIESDHSADIWRSLGATSPFHSTAGGLAVLAYASEDDVREIIDEGLTRYTQHTITDPAALRAELRRTYERGYAISLEATRAHVCSVGAPVFDEVGTPVAAVTIALPDFRCTPARMPGLGEQTVAAAGQVNKQLRSASLRMRREVP